MKFKNYLKIIVCKIHGHKYKDARQYFLPARECEYCGNRQVKVPDIATNPGWHNVSRKN